MRTLVDLPETELEELTALSRARKTSRAELIRQAVAGFLVTATFLVIWAGIYACVRSAPPRDLTLIASLNLGFLLVLYAFRIAQDRLGNTNKNRSAPAGGTSL